MRASYIDAAFKLHLPTYEVTNNRVRVDFKFERQIGNKEKIIFYKAIITDRVNVSHISINHHVYENGKRYHYDWCEFEDEKRKIFVNNSVLKLVFFSNVGERTEVSFKIIAQDKCMLLDVSKFSMTEEEKNIYIDTIRKENKKVYELENKKVEFEQNDKNSNNDIKPMSVSGIEKYMGAMRTEKLFLMHEGGRKYKVTNGKLISKDKGIYSYIFDLETELHIADDSPIKIEIGIQTASGTVLMCEDFQIIIQIENNIGNRIGSAVISVEPWKLLEALEKRIQYGIGINKSKMAARLFNEGPSMSTTDSEDNIPKGQEEVIKKAISEPICIVWGPPGTGKTHTMSEIAIKFQQEGKSVLIVSHSNVSVDGVAKKIDELLRKKGKEDILKEGKVLRYGYVRDEELNKNSYVNSFYYTVAKSPVMNGKLDNLQEEYDNIKHTKGLGSQRIIEIRKEITKIRGQIREQEQIYVSEASIVATTISKIMVDKTFQDKKYDVVMFDEVSMAYVLQVVCAATFAKEHLICVGDFMQLAPIAQSREKKILCEDLFSFLKINQNGKIFYHPWLVMLDEQRRMQPRIANFANKYIYHNLLKNHLSTYTSREKIVESELFKGQAINLIDLTGCYCAASKNADNSRFNILSAIISFSAAIKTEKNDNNVSVITPYAAQTRLIRALILDYRKENETNIRCATVHQFQGSESDVIYFDAVESYPAKKPGWLMGKDFNSILRLINVAVTRARGKLVTVADYRFWDNNFKGTNHTFYKLLSYLKNNGNIIEHKDGTLEKMIDNLSVDGGPKFYVDCNQYINKLLTDLLNAKGKIVVSLPTGSFDLEYEDEIYRQIKKAKIKGIRVLIKCNNYANLPEKWKEYTWGTDNATFPIIMIDDYITWYGVPFAKWSFSNLSREYNTVCKIACRIKGEHTAEMINSLSDLEYKETKGGKSILEPRPEATEANTNGLTGLSAYVEQNMKCPTCKKPLIMSKGKSGKTILWCKECKKTELLRPDDINRYMNIGNVKCPQHNCYMEAKLGKYGLYIRCEAGHYVKPEEI